MFRYLPSPDSDFAPTVDFITYLVTDISVFFTVAIVGTMIYFAVKYRKRDGVDHETPHIHGSFLLEFIWTIVPTIVCIIVAWYGVQGYRVMREVPAGAEEINVIGQKWAWNFQYANGKETNGEFTVPVNRPVKLILTSKDVLHSFFVPGMRTKVDAIPGQYTYQWFKPVRTGPQQVYCTEYCGDAHSAMLAKMNVVSEADYERWLNQKEDTGSTPADKGKFLYSQKLPCKSCHSLDGSRLVGPSFKGLFGREGKLVSGETYKADENYIKESILYPGNKVVEGYPAGVMPGYEGQISDEEIGDLIAYLKAMNEEPAEAEAPAAAAEPVAMSEEEKKFAELKNAVPQVAQCAACHNVTGAPGGVGPTWKGLYGHAGKLADGGDYTADDEYIKESILQPQAKIVQGYPGAMPSYQGQLSDEQIQKIVSFMKDIK